MYLHQFLWFSFSCCYVMNLSLTRKSLPPSLADIVRGSRALVSCTIQRAGTCTRKRLDPSQGGESIEGHSGHLVVERKPCVAVAQLSQVGTVCEIGFDGGHGALIWLRATSQAHVIIFATMGPSPQALPSALFLPPNGQQSSVSHQSPPPVRHINIDRGRPLDSIS